jgi:hypothetical protein
MSTSQARLCSVVLCADGGALRLSVHEYWRFCMSCCFIFVYWGFSISVWQSVAHLSPDSHDRWFCNSEHIVVQVKLIHSVRSL